MYWIALLAVLSVSSVFSAPSTPAQDRPEESLFSGAAAPVLEEAQVFLDQGRPEQAIRVLEEYLDAHPESPGLDHILFQQAVALSAGNQEARAVAVLQQLIEEYPLSEQLGPAKLMLGRLYLGQQAYGKAERVLQEARSQAFASSTRRDAIGLLRTLYLEQHEYRHAIQIALSELDLGTEEERTAVREQLKELILQQLNEQVLRDLRLAFPKQYPGDLVRIRLIEMYAARGEESLAEWEIRQFLERFPNHQYAQTAEALRQSYLLKLKSYPHLITALLPLTGRLESFAEEALNGVRFALEEASSQWGLRSVGLLIKDSSSHASNLRSELTEMATQFRPTAVIGPMLSQQLPLIGEFAQEYRIPFITPGATAPNVRRFGSFLFSTSLTFPLQIERLAEYTRHQLGYERFCILYPDTAYGRQMAELFRQHIERQGGMIVAEESFDATDTDVGPQIKRLKAADLKQHGTIETVTFEEDDASRVYVPGFQAVFVPASGVQVASVAAQLAFYDVDVTLLGPNSWHTPAVIQWGRQFVENGLLVDGWFLESTDPVIRDFIERYRQRFHAPPGLFARQAYDAARLVLKAIQDGARSGEDVHQQLLVRHDLSTLEGLVSFGYGGVLNRRVYVLKIQEGRFVQVE